MNNIIKNYGLDADWEWFVKFNPSNNLPYHNKYHAECMVKNCYEGAQYYNLPWDTTRNLLLAAIYHDFGHTGGEEPDSENIRRALHHGLFSIRKEVPKILIDCILCTEYPFTVEPYTIEQRIIRDADLMQFRFGDWQEMLFTSLRKEIEVQYGRSISDEEMLKGMKDFWINKAKFHTDWGREIFEAYGGPLKRYIKAPRWL